MKLDLEPVIRRKCDRLGELTGELRYLEAMGARDSFAYAGKNLSLQCVEGSLRVLEGMLDFEDVHDSA